MVTKFYQTALDYVHFFDIEFAKLIILSKENSLFSRLEAKALQALIHAPCHPVFSTGSVALAMLRGLFSFFCVLIVIL